MSLTFPDGSVVGFSTAFATPVVASAISNANPAVATITAAAVTSGQVLVCKSPWAGLNQRIAVAGTVAGTSCPLLGINTAAVTEYPIGGGANTTLMAATTFVDFSQQGELSNSGGEPQTYTGKWLEDPLGKEFQVPVGQSAQVYTLPLDMDRSLPWFAAAKAASRKRTPIVLRVRLPNGDMYYQYAYMHFNSALGLTAGQPIKNTATFYVISPEDTLIEAAP